MANLAIMILDDPDSFHVLTTDMKEKIIEAATNKVNIQAAMTRKKAIANIQRNFTLRNSWTTKQVQFTPMPKGRYSLSVIQATIGITDKAAYMERQELGGKRKPLKGKSLAIATDAARGGSRSSAVVRSNYLSRIKKKIVRPEGGYLTDGSHGARIVSMAAQAAKKGGFISTNRKLFRVDNFVQRGDGVSFRLRQMYGFDRRYTVTSSQPWLLPAVETAAKEGENIFIKEMKKAGF